jgi:hypothetical protein
MAPPSKRALKSTKPNSTEAGPYSLTDGGIKSIDRTRLPRDPLNGCQPVYPWNFIRTNTIYGVIHAAGGYTVWCDKHAIDDAVGGPTGTTAQPNVDDYYSPEVNSKPDFQASTVTSFVETMQLAPTILQALGLDPGSLDAVKKEGTPALPGLSFKQD